MSEQKHTQGPWHVFSVYAQHEVRTPTDTLVAVVNSRDDARLIATATDLLDEHQQWAAMFGEALILALQGDYSKVDELAKCLPMHFTNGSAALKSAAIAKASGAQP